MFFRITQRFILTILLTLSLVACSKDDIDVSNLLYIWTVVSIQTIDSIILYIPPEEKVTITFQKNNTFNVQLEVNVCEGNFNIAVPNSMSINSVGCAYAYCDSEFSQKFIELLPQTTTYTIGLTLFNNLGFLGLDLQN